MNRRDFLAMCGMVPISVAFGVEPTLSQNRTATGMVRYEDLRELRIWVGRIQRVILPFIPQKISKATYDDIGVLTLKISEQTARIATVPGVSQPCALYKSKTFYRHDGKLHSYDLDNEPEIRRGDDDVYYFIVGLKPGQYATWRAWEKYE